MRSGCPRGATGPRRRHTRSRSPDPAPVAHVGDRGRGVGVGCTGFAGMSTLCHCTGQLCLVIHHSRGPTLRRIIFAVCTCEPGIRGAKRNATKSWRAGGSGDCAAPTSTCRVCCCVCGGWGRFIAQGLERNNFKSTCRFRAFHSHRTATGPTPTHSILESHAMVLHTPLGQVLPGLGIHEG